MDDFGDDFHNLDWVSTLDMDLIILHVFTFDFGILLMNLKEKLGISVKTFLK